MRYFIDTEFLEGSQKSWFGNTKPTIDLISIGIVSEDNREYYAISKEFNLKEAWNRYDLDYGSGDQRNYSSFKIYWIRKNVLFPIWKELFHKDGWNKATTSDQFTYKSLKDLINKYGKSNKQIAEEIKMFVALKDVTGGFGTRMPLDNSNNEYEDRIRNLLIQNMYYKPEFYGFYCDYDWVVFCWLFGRMIDLPKGFPMYCIDLKQTLDEKADPEGSFRKSIPFVNFFDMERSILSKEQWLDAIRAHTNYPKQENEHNALADARWNKQLFEFLNSL